MSEIQKPPGPARGIIGVDGRKLKSAPPPKRLNPFKTGIEEIIKLNEDGKGIEMSDNDLRTLLIYELARTKKLALSQNIRIEELEKQTRD